MSLPTASPKGRILAVDDIIDNLILIRAILESEGYEVTLATDGATALAEIEQTLPELVLLDVMMPGMDGYEVTRRIRQNQKLPYIPILLVTAHGQSSVVKGLDAGADDFVRKPFDTDELLARVRSLLRLKRSLDQQDQMARQREDFVSRLTHDLRTPLVAVDRMLHLFQEEAFCPISDEMKEAIATMIQSNQHLLQMVNTLLEVYRHEAGQKEIMLAPCNIQEICHNVIQELTPLAAQKGLDFSLESMAPSPNSKVILLGDALELRRVLLNLISNAIKFTDSGSIRVRLSNATAPLPQPQPTAQSQNLQRSEPALGSRSGWLKIEVEDTGVGISPEDQTVIFERFRQGNNKRADSGLGLYLSRRIVEAHQGTIAIESELGKGSRFIVLLPLQVETQNGEQPNAAPSPATTQPNSSSNINTPSNIQSSTSSNTSSSTSSSTPSNPQPSGAKLTNSAPQIRVAEIYQ